jgi:hypothetical protein
MLHPERSESSSAYLKVALSLDKESYENYGKEN